jgi:hypothetical protein
MSDRAYAEYLELRATIRQRGTARLVLAPVIFVGWAGAAVATGSLNSTAISMLVPLLVLAAGFEALFALHINVERIGRYVQVFHEPDGGWEHVAMTFGQRFPATGAPDPLFSRLFVFAVSANFIPVALWADSIPEIAVFAAFHLVLVNRIRVARGIAARQRGEDLERFTAIKNETR